MLRFLHFMGDFQGSSSSLPIQAGADVCVSFTPSTRATGTEGPELHPRNGGFLRCFLGPLGECHLIFGQKHPIYRDIIKPLL